MMKLKSLLTPAALLAVFTLISAPSFAGQSERGRRDRSTAQDSGRTAERAQPRSGATNPRTEPRREATSPRTEPRREATSPRTEPRREATSPRSESRRDAISPRVDGRQSAGRDFGRNGGASRGERSFSPRYEPRYAPRYNYAPRYYAPRYSYRPYVFRPRFSIGFGIFSGYPVPYSYSYPYPVPVYGYSAPRGPVVIGPGSNVYGGVSLEITPDDGEVWVDGTYAGVVRDFDGTSQPLTLAAGTHRVEVRAQGYEPLSIDIGVQPGQVIPYRGDMRPY
jgi:hypothetical protein